MMMGCDLMSSEGLCVESPQVEDTSEVTTNGFGLVFLGCPLWHLLFEFFCSTVVITDEVCFYNIQLWALWLKHCVIIAYKKFSLSRSSFFTTLLKNVICLKCSLWFYIYLYAVDCIVGSCSLLLLVSCLVFVPSHCVGAVGVLLC